MRQSTDTVVMVAPTHFGYNAETAVSNRLSQPPDGSVTPHLAWERAQEEFWNAVGVLKEAGINVIVLPSPPNTPDAVYPNNWFSTDEHGRLTIFKMANASRTAEIQPDTLFKTLMEYGFQRPRIVRPFTDVGGALEGTGSLVFDHVNAVAYAALSPRTNQGLVESYCQEIGYTPVTFRTRSSIYHTNVMMSIGTGWAICCRDEIVPEDRHRVLTQLADGGLKLSIIDPDQMQAFCGNVLEVLGENGRRCLVMSTSAYDAFTMDALAPTSIGAHGWIVVPIPTIEAVGGGGIRCMLAEIFLPTVL